MNRWAAAIFVFVLAAPCLARAAEDFCRELWNKMTPAQREKFQAEADNRVLTKTEPEMRSLMGACFATEHPKMFEELDGLCEEGAVTAALLARTVNQHTVFCWTEAEIAVLNHNLEVVKRRLDALEKRLPQVNRLEGQGAKSAP